MAGVAALFAVQVILTRYVPGYGVPDVLGDMLPPTMLAALMAVGAAAAAVIVTLVSRRRPDDQEPATGRVDLFLLLGLIGGGFGLFAAAWSWLAMAAASRQVGGVSFEVAAPSYAEMSLAIGLLSAAVAFTCRAIRSR